MQSWLHQWYIDGRLEATKAPHVLRWIAGPSTRKRRQMPPRPLSELRIAYTKFLFRRLLKARTQRELADALGVDQGRVSAALTAGKMGPPGLRKAAILAGRPPDEADKILSGEAHGSPELYQLDLAEPGRDASIAHHVLRVAVDESYDHADTKAAMTVIQAWGLAGDVSDSLIHELLRELSAVRRHIRLQIDIANVKAHLASALQELERLTSATSDLEGEIHRLAKPPKTDKK